MRKAGPTKAKAPRVLKRRHVLLGAGGVAGGLAAARLLGLYGDGPALPQLARVPSSDSGAGDWNSPLDRPEARVAQLLRRATFGATRAEYEQSLADGFAKTVDRLVETPIAEPQPFPGGDDATRAKPLNIGELRTWWVNWMLASPTPFGERMTLFWHGHFTSDYRKVTLQSPFIYWQNLTWRKFALSKLRTMLKDVTIDPAMLRYLDLATSTGKNPNENYSRELMELFSMGVGSYNEDDVRSGAKALSGWREPLTPAMLQDLLAQAQQRGRTPRTTPKPDEVKTGVFDAARASAGPVTFLGETKVFDADAVIDRILKQDATAPFIVTKALREFAHPDPDAGWVKRLGDRFRKSGYDVKQLMRDVFTSPEFVAPAAYRSLVKSPTEFMVHAARAVEAPSLAKGIAAAGATMGQSLFDPPEVGGWPSNVSWISSNNLLARINFVTSALSGLPKLAAFKDSHVAHLDAVVGPDTAELLNSTQDEPTRWLILLASPEFQLK